jgi:ubiquinone/menaquinone biosynthesis C-methylase UbiE
MHLKILLVSLLDKFRKLTEHPLKRLEEIGLKEGMTFLDVGCSLGFYSFPAASLVGDSGTVYALDIKEGLIKHVQENIARLKIKNMKPIVANAERTGLAERSVDIVFVHLVLHDIDDQQAAVEEFYRVLRPPGKLVVDEEHAMLPELVRVLVESSGFRLLETLRNTIQVFEKIEHTTD